MRRSDVLKATFAWISAAAKSYFATFGFQAASNRRKARQKSRHETDFKYMRLKFKIKFTAGKNGEGGAAMAERRLHRGRYVAFIT
jgi:hypothetical protein